MARLVSNMNQPKAPDHQASALPQRVTQSQHYGTYVTVVMTTTGMMAACVILIFRMYEEDLDVVLGGFLTFLFATMNIALTVYMVSSLVSKQETYDRMRDAQLQTINDQTMQIVGKFQVVQEKYGETSQQYEDLRKEYLLLQKKFQQEQLQHRLSLLQMSQQGREEQFPQQHLPENDAVPHADKS